VPEIVAVYPSGRKIKVLGVFRVLPLEGYPNGLPSVDQDEDGAIMVLDLRAIVTSDGIEVYNGKDVQL
jgi:hypothetical protein